MKKIFLLIFFIAYSHLSVLPAESAKNGITVTKFIFRGNTVFSGHELSETASKYEKREITLGELEDLRYKLTMLYVEKGYINSGVRIPEQKLPGEDGTVLMDVVEGTLGDVKISGNGWLRSSYMEKRIRLGSGPPLNMGQLQERLQIIQNNPLVETINAELKPGIEKGKADLDVTIKETTPYHAGFQFSNSYSPGAGSMILETFASHENLTGNGDSLIFKYGFTESLYDYSGSYSMPINPRDTTIRFAYSRNSSTLIEEPFDELDIDSRSENFEFSVIHPAFRTPQSDFLIGLTAQKEYSETSLLDKPFSFSEGVIDGKTDISVVRFSQDLVLKSGYQVVALRSLFNLGINSFNSTDNTNSPDSQFFKWIGQFQWARQIENLSSSQIIFRTDTQLSGDALLPLEQFAIGGGKSVRGYRENQLVRDNGVVSSIELRIPVLSLAIPGLSKNQDDGKLFIAPFFDYGAGWNTRRKSQGSLSISSVGLGLRYSPSKDCQAQAYWGYPLRDIDNPDTDLQDQGFHFLLYYRL